MYICNYCFCVSVGSANEMKELEKRFEEESWTPFLAEGWCMYVCMYVYVYITCLIYCYIQNCFLTVCTYQLVI